MSESSRIKKIVLINGKTNEIIENIELSKDLSKHLFFKIILVKSSLSPLRNTDFNRKTINIEQEQSVTEPNLTKQTLELNNLLNESDLTTLRSNKNLSSAQNINFKDSIGRILNYNNFKRTIDKNIKTKEKVMQKKSKRMSLLKLESKEVFSNTNSNTDKFSNSIRYFDNSLGVDSKKDSRNIKEQQMLTIESKSSVNSTVIAKPLNKISSIFIEKKNSNNVSIATKKRMDSFKDFMKLESKNVEDLKNLKSRNIIEYQEEEFLVKEGNQTYDYRLSTCENQKTLNLDVNIPPSRPDNFSIDLTSKRITPQKLKFKNLTKLNIKSKHIIMIIFSFLENRDFKKIFSVSKQFKLLITDVLLSQIKSVKYKFTQSLKSLLSLIKCNLIFKKYKGKNSKLILYLKI